MYVVKPIREHFVFGVIHRTLRRKTYNTTEYVCGKLFPVAPLVTAAVNEPWRPTASRWDVLLPDGAANMLTSPKLLCEQFEAAAPHNQRDLLSAVKLIQSDSRPSHVLWERGRRFGRLIVDQHHAPVILIQHMPAATGMRNAPPAHLHLLILARSLSEHGFGQFGALHFDDAQEKLIELWDLTA